jgi:DNA-binding NarL/FixJ family response regulator
MSIKIAIADDHMLVINGLKAMVEKYEHISVVFAAGNGQELMELLSQNTIDVLLLDIQMPGQNGIDLCKNVSREYPEIKIIALTNLEESHFVKQMIRNGAAGYLLKNVGQDILIKAIETVLDGKQYLDAQIQQNMLNEVLSGKKRTSQGVLLTKREEEILALVAKEMTSQEIADKLFISLRTVQTHRLNLAQKLGVNNTAGLVNEAYKRGLA